jgi:hypothetical protein
VAFHVGPLPEFAKSPARVGEDPNFPRPALIRSFDTSVDTSGTPAEITLPTVVNGQVLPGRVDRFQFRVKKGMYLVAVVQARELIPYLPDAVPCWFQATLALHDAKGKELAYSDDYRFHPDPVFHYEVPADGTYTIEIKDAVYRGREDFVYRITLGELPFITSLFPLGGKAGTPTTVALRGWNLPATSLSVGGADTSATTRWVSLSKGSRTSNLMPFAVDTLPECLEQEPNDRPENAQTIALPVIVNGRVGKPGDVDVVRFEGKAGAAVVAEVRARRLESPLDSVLRLTDASGRQLAFNDDHEDKGTGLLTHHADSILRTTLPADGTYFLYLSDAQHKGGDEYAYRLRVSAPRPDFALRVTPASVNLRGGATIPLTVYALRKDGFAGPITLTLKDPPDGFSLAGGLVPTNQDQVRITLTGQSAPTEQPVTLAIEGWATIGGETLMRPAVPAEDMMQAFAYRHLVPAHDMKVNVTGRVLGRNALRIQSATPVLLPAGGTARVRVGMPPGAAATGVKFQLELNNPPDGITIEAVTISGPGAEVVLKCDAAKVKPGTAGNLIVDLYAQRPQVAAKKKAQANRRPPPIGTLPAIPFEVVVGARPKD